MTASRSPYYQLRQIEMAVRRVQPDTDVERVVTNAYAQLQKRIALAVATVRDYERYEVEEDTKAQLRTLPKVIKSIEQVRESILKVSEYDVIGAVDVAQMTAELDELIGRLR